MSKARYYIEINETKIPVIVRNYKGSNNLKLYFSGDILNVSKPRWYSIDNLKKEYGQYILNEYRKIILPENNILNFWKDGAFMLYKGQNYNIKRKIDLVDKLEVLIDNDKKVISIIVPNKYNDEIRIKELIDSKIKNILRKETYFIIENKLDYWCKKMNLSYNSFKVNDTKSKYGSCMPKQRKLFFSLRLAMLKEEIIDAIVVHELSHIVYPNHSIDFYNLIKNIFQIMIYVING